MKSWGAEQDEIEREAEQLGEIGDEERFSDSPIKLSWSLLLPKINSFSIPPH